MTMNERIYLEILECTNPSCFTAQASCSEERRKFLDAQKEWSGELESKEETIVINYQPHLQEICAAKCGKEGWQRVKVEQIFHTCRGQQARCFFIDSGQKQQIAVFRLRQLPERYLSVPSQVRTLKLWGLRPLTLKLELSDTGIDVPERVSKTWDISAVSLFKELVEKSCGAQADVMHTDVEGTMYVRLHLHLPDGWLCVNDKLVAEKYAIRKSFPDSGAESDSGGSTSSSQHVIVRTRNCLKQQLSPSSDVSTASGRATMMPADNMGKFDDVSCDDPLVTNKMMMSEEELNQVMAKIIHISSCPQGYQSDTDAKTFWGKKLLGLQLEIPRDQRAKDVTKQHIQVGHGSVMLQQDSGSLNTGVSMHLVGKCPGPHSLGTVLPSGVLPHRQAVVGTGRGRGLHQLLSTEVLESLQHTSARASFPACDGSPGENVTACCSKMLGVSQENESECEDLPGAITQHLTDCREAHLLHLNPLSTGNLPSQDLKPSPAQLSTILGSPLADYTSIQPSSSSVSVARGEDCQSFLPPSTRASFCEQTTETSTQDFTPDPEDSGFKSEGILGVLSVNERSCGRRSRTVDEMGGGSQTSWAGQVASGFRPQDCPQSVDCPQSSPEEDEGENSLLVKKNKLLGRQEGRKLLESIGGGRDDAYGPSQLPQVWRSDRTMPIPFLGTLVWANLLPEPIFKVEDVAFADFIKQNMMKEIKTSRAIQAHSWPSILRLRHVVGVAPPGSGKTMAYLPALLSLLTESSCQYLSLPKGSGPKALLLVPSWNKAHQLGEYMNGLLGQRTTLRTIVIYAGGREETQVIPLIEGCDILVATPHCLLRMIDRSYTNLRRLCHLILDDAEVLVEEFTPQIQQIMTIYASCLEHRQLLVPHQVLVFSSSWTPGVASFNSQYQWDPVMVFASRLEASVVGKVQQVVHLCLDDFAQRLMELLSQLTAGSEHQRIIIAAEKDEHVHDVAALLYSQSIYTEVVVMGMSFEEVEEKVKHWQTQAGSSAILVVPDSMIVELQVTCAQVVIHYDLPRSKTTFGNRLTCMMDYFHCSMVEGCANKDEKPPALRPVSHIMISSAGLDRKRLDHIRSLRDFLNRSGALIPPGLSALLAGMYEGLNEDSSKSLCEHVRAFGRCINEIKCPHRHLVLPVDSVQDDGAESWPPGTGQVKIRVGHIISANHYFARLLEHRIVGQPTRDLRSVYTSLMPEMTRYLCKPANQAPYALEEGTQFLAAVRDRDGVFMRARVLTTLEDKLRRKSSKVKVQYIDEGLTDMVDMEQLLKLPPHLQDVPPQVVEVYVCRVKPLDGDAEWTQRSNEFVKERVAGKELMGTVVLRMKDTLWLDPLSEQICLPSLKACAVTMIVRNELLKHNMASDNPDHIKNLYQLCEGKFDIPQKLIEKYLSLLPRQYIDTEVLSANADYHEVFVTVVNSPHQFFVQKCSQEAELEAMVRELNQHMEKVTRTGSEGAADSPQKSKSPSSRSLAGGATSPSGETSVPNTADVTQQTASQHTSPCKAGRTQQETLDAGSVCASKFVDDNRWYRGRLMEEMEGGWRVFFIDYGECEFVADGNIHRLPDNFCVMSAQAIECSLASIVPPGSGWSPESGDALWDMSHYVTGEKKVMLARVQETGDAEFAGLQKCIVDLYDTTLTSRDVFVNQEMVWLGLAGPLDDRLTYLFPKATLSARKLYASLDEKICDICAAIYWSENEERTLAKNASDCLMAELKLRCKGTLLESGALQEVVKLIGYLKSCDTLSILLSAIVRCVEAKPSLCLAAAGEELMLRLVFCLEQSRSPSVQVPAAAAAVELSKVDGFFQALDQEAIVTVFCHALEADPVPEMLHHICCFLTGMLHRGKVCPNVLKVKQLTVCETALQLLSQTKNLESKELLLGLLAAVAIHDNLQVRLLREKTVKQILDIIKEAPSHQCVFHCASICHSLCQTSRRNKRLLLEGGLVLIIRDLLAGGLQSPAKEVCEELNSSLAISIPQQEVLMGTCVTRQPVSSEGIISPLVKWGQNTFRVLLTVQLWGAKETDFIISQNEIHCRCEVDSQRYGFHYILFGDLVKERSRVKVGVAEVRLSLAKLQKGMWSRLTREKQKFPSLVADYDHLVDTGSESEVEDDENLTVLARKRVVCLPKPKQRPTPEEQFSYSEGDDSEDSLDSHSDDERFDKDDDIDYGAYVDMVLDQKAEGTSC